jgi:hypothetical protein
MSFRARGEENTAFLCAQAAPKDEENFIRQCLRKLTHAAVTFFETRTFSALAPKRGRLHVYRYKNPLAMNIWEQM